MVLYLNLHSTNHNDVLCRDCEQVSQSCSKPLMFPCMVTMVPGALLNFISRTLSIQLFIMG